MHGTINVGLLTREDQRHAAAMKRIQANEARPNDPDRLEAARRITAKIHRVIWRYQHHQLTQQVAAVLIHSLERDLPY